MALGKGTRLGTYEILGPLGAGGMGEVYRANDLRLGREVALKILPSDVATDRDRLDRFEREARMVAGLNHPNIVTLYSIEDEDGQRFLTMERLEGNTLAQLAQPKGISLARLLEIAIPLSDALAAAHERGVIHRDLKPGNVMVTSDGRVKVLDFGLATLAPESGVTGSVQTRSTLSAQSQLDGTPPYMAPEQLRGQVSDARADLFSFGIILWELATGRRPFGGESFAEVCSSILRDAAAPLREVRPDLPADLDRVVSRCLEKNPRERAQSALDVGNELRRLKRDAETGESGPRGTASIAVLPFVNRSRNEDDEYFSDGLADELLSVLSKIAGLRVSARASSFYFKGKDVPLREIGNALRVDTVLDGTVRKAGNRLRVSVQLVNVSNGYHLWSETYDRTLDDVFAVQDDIAQSVVNSLRTTLLRGRDQRSTATVQADVAKAAKGRGTNPEAHRLYLQARHLMDRMTPDDVARGIDLLNRAVGLDPGFARAWAQAANGRLKQAGFGWLLPLDRVLELAREAAAKALFLEPDLAEAHLEISWLRLFEYDWEGAEAALSRALQIAPGDASVLREAGSITRSLGRHEEAVDLLQRACDLDPLSGAAYHVLGTALRASGRLVEAEAALRKALELSPRRTSTSVVLARVLISLDRTDDGLAVVDQEPDEILRLWGLAMVHQALGHRAESEAAIQSMIEKDPDGAAYQIAIAYAALRDSDAAFKWLEHARVQGDLGLHEIRSRQDFQPLYSDPRWDQFLKKIRASPK